MMFARQSTAKTVMIGPVLDADGVAVTGGVVGDFKISKNGAAPGALDGSATATHRHTGFYSLALTANDLDTVGSAQVTIDDTVNACPMVNLVVVEEAVYDALYAASAPGYVANAPVNAAQISGSGTAADNLETAALAYSATRGLAGTALPAAAADAAGGLIISDAGGLDADNRMPAATAITNMNTVFNTDFATNYDATNDMWMANVKRVNGTAQTAGDLSAQIDAVDNFVDTEIAAIVTTLGTPAGASLAADLVTIDNFVDGLESALTTLTTRLTGLVVAQGTIGSTGNDTTHLHLTGLTYGNDEINNWLIVIYDVSEAEYHSRWIEDWVLSTALATVATLPFTPQNATDTYWLLPIRQDVTGGSGLDAAGVRAAIGLASANLDTQLADLPTVAEFEARTLVAASYATASALDTVDNFLDTEIAAIISTLGTPSNLGGGATVAGNLSDIESQTDDIGTAGAGLTAVPWNASWDAEVQSEVDDALVAQNLDHLVKSAVDTDFATTVHLNSVIGHLADNGTSATFDRTTDSLEALQAEHDSTQSTLSTISGLVDDLEGRLTSTRAGYLDNLSGGAVATAAALDTVDNFLDTEIAAIVAAIGTPSNLGGGATLAANLSDIESQTDDIGAAGAGLTAVVWNAAWDAEVQSEVTDALTTALTESYRADQATGSVAQMLYELIAHHGEATNSGTTRTLKKIDGSTTAMTFTFNDASNPTSVTRAT